MRKSKISLDHTLKDIDYFKDSANYPDFILGLQEEFGEVARAIRKGKNKFEIMEEVGDMIVFATAILHAHGYTLEDTLEYAAGKVVNKENELQKRK